MILVLNGADFSENNLGQVYVNPNIDAFTEAAILASGNTAMTTTQKVALNEFFKQIGAFGSLSNIWSKLQKVYLPFIAGDVSKAVYDYVGGAYDGTPTDTSWQLRNKGLVGKLSTMPNTGDDCIAVAGQSTFLPKVADLSAFILYAEEPISTPAYLFSYEGSSGSNRFYVSISKSGDGKATLTLGGVSPSANVAKAVNLNNANVKGKLVGISVRSSSDISFIRDDGTFSSMTNSDIDNFSQADTYGKYGPFSSSQWRGNPTETESVGAIIIGESLTDAQMTALQNAANTLATYFL